MIFIAYPEQMLNTSEESRSWLKATEILMISRLDLHTFVSLEGLTETGNPTVIFWTIF